MAQLDTANVSQLHCFFIFSVIGRAEFVWVMYCCMSAFISLVEGVSRGEAAGNDHAPGDDLIIT